MKKAAAIVIGLLSACTSAYAASGDLLVSGKLGVGTVSPLTPIYVNGPAIPSFTGLTRGLVSLVTPYDNASSTTLDFLYSGNNNPVARIGAKTLGAGSYLMLGTSNDYGLGVTNSAVTIDPSGNVGIGTTSPSKLLHVSASDTGTNLLVENTSSTVPRWPGVTVDDYVGNTYGHSYLQMRHAGGTKAAPSATTVSGSPLGALIASGHDGNGFVQSGRISFYPEAISLPATTLPLYHLWWEAEEPILKRCE